jgi:GntR family transcriptional regulator/MocR family aminotransferase
MTAVVARHGSGTYVVEVLPISPRLAVRPAGDALDQRLNRFWLQPDVTAAMGFWWEGFERVPSASASDEIDFRPAVVDCRLFPFDAFRRSMVRQLRRWEQCPASFKIPPGDQGSYHLRQAIARHIGIARAVVCGEDDSVVTAAHNRRSTC